MKYLEIKVDTTEGAVDYITALLESMEIYGTIVNAKSTALDILDKKEVYEWDYVDPEVFIDEEVSENSEAEIIFYLEEDKFNRFEIIEKNIKNLRKKKGEIDFGSLTITSNEMDDEDWIQSYKSTLKPVDIGEDIIIVPTWWEEKYNKAKIEIKMDPGMAFGTGDHPTTSMCARFLQEENCFGKNILDVGTGSGILAIIGEKLGSNKILGVDIDPVAVQVAKENILLNDCQNIDVLEADLTKGIDFIADIVVGNLMAEVVCILAKSVKKHLRKGGIFISSGILLEKETMVKNVLIEEGFDIEEVKYKDEWCAIKGRKI